jgi:hypothetical protein
VLSKLLLSLLAQLRGASSPSVPKGPLISWLLTGCHRLWALRVASRSDRDKSLSWGRKMLKPMLVPIRLELNERPRLALSFSTSTLISQASDHSTGLSVILLFRLVNYSGRSKRGKDSAKQVA